MSKGGKPYKGWFLRGRVQEVGAFEGVVKADGVVRRRVQGCGVVRGCGQRGESS